jgi:hypothetical protein
MQFWSVNVDPKYYAVKRFLEKTAMMGNVIGVPQNMEHVKLKTTILGYIS